jgi:hypothetical protein
MRRLGLAGLMVLLQACVSPPLTDGGRVSGVGKDEAEISTDLQRMYRTNLLIALAAFPGLILGRPEIPRASGDVSSCLADSALASAVTSRIEVLVLRRDSTYLSKIGLLPTDTAQVSLVTENRTCAVALTAYNAYLRQKGRPPVQGAFVVRAGPNRFAVTNGAPLAGEFAIFLTFDPEWVLIKGFGG